MYEMEMIKRRLNGEPQPPKPPQRERVVLVDEVEQPPVPFPEVLEDTLGVPVERNGMVCNLISSDEPDNAVMNTEDSAGFPVKECGEAAF